MYGRTIEEQLIIDVHNYTTGRCKSYLTHLYVKISVFIYGMSTLDRLTCSLLSTLTFCDRTELRIVRFFKTSQSDQHDINLNQFYH